MDLEGVVDPAGRRHQIAGHLGLHLRQQGSLIGRVLPGFPIRGLVCGPVAVVTGEIRTCTRRVNAYPAQFDQMHLMVTCQGCQQRQLGVEQFGHRAH